jgi:hypothetical protein
MKTKSPPPYQSLRTKGPRSNKLAFLLAVAGALRRCPPLAVLALRRVGRLALHPATTAKMHNLLLRGP